jgi:pimeloyl-ACP methyl ester carboxylesterase
MKETFLSRLADRLILRPSSHAIPVDGKSRHLVPFGEGELEIWTHRIGNEGADIDVFVLKFPGNAGRAERSTDAPACFWSNTCAEMWTVNPPGYGGSTGPASIQKIAAVAATAFDRLQQHARGRPVVVVGNSLGGVAALSLAATRNIDALVLRNPPPLRQLIVGRHGWWNLTLGARLIARQVPEELCSIRNAQLASASLVYVMSGKDHMVPVKYQQRIIDAYTGEKKLLILPNADHATPMIEDEVNAYRELLNWLWSKIETNRERAEI